MKPIESAVLDTIIMRLNETNSLEYIQDKVKKISARRYYEIKAKLKEDTKSRLYEIAKGGFAQQHMERIDQLQICQRLMWEHYQKISDDWKKILALEKIASLQPYLSAYYEASKKILENDSKAGNSIS
ncbi:MAG: hypothetical protein HY223_05175 [Thaumarchaeota archaeon]|nr:hypothetical protein [Nitrososphaerota archaeon]